ncbi:MAG: methyltransferase domain-containing protein [Planctomycetes bacterium]|nr:methyltransferase domain-containing protein [Planctomycetota bacterium]MCB9888776.1 methyltransferase domain-containing protein [Planctomycetota bacterium]
MRPIDRGELLRGCRMVLHAACGSGAFLEQLRTLGVPAVGLEREPAVAATARARGLRVFAGGCEVLRHHRRKFDGIVVSEELSEQEVDATASALLPGGILLFERGSPARQPEGLRTRDDGVWQRLPDREPPRACGVLVGPYADALVDCGRVLELGCGTGHFLDALVLRGCAPHGIDGRPDSVAACRARGLDVTSGDLRSAVAHHRDCDAVYLGNLLDGLPAAHHRTVLHACHTVLRDGGRLLLRIAPDAVDPRALLAQLHELGFTDLQSGVVAREQGHAFVFASRSGCVPPLDLALADGIPLTPSDRAIDAPRRDLYDLERFERRVLSQTGEDGVLAAIFAEVGTTDCSYVEFGCGDGVQCNTAALRRAGWSGLLMDGMAEPAAQDAVIHREWIDADNIDALLCRHGVPREFDLLSIDLDGNDYWVWQAIRHRPRVVVIEYNANLAVDQSLTIPYDPAHRWDGSDFYGASLRALAELGTSLGYRLVYCSQSGVNAFFVAEELVGALPRQRVEDIYRPPNYWYRGARQLPDLGRCMVEP